MKRGRRVLAMSLVGLPLLASACGSIPPAGGTGTGESEQALYEAAKQEGGLTWLTAYYQQDATQALVDAFEAHYPGVKVTFARQTAQIIYLRLTQEQQAKAHVTDVFSSTDEAQYLEQKKKGRLRRYRPRGSDQLRKEFQHLDPDDTYQLGAVAFVVINYNPGKAGGGPLPTRWTDLLDARYAGRITVGNPTFSGYVGNWVVAMLDKYGEDYFRQLHNNQPKINRSIFDTVTQVVAGERDFGVGSESFSLDRKAAGQPIDVIYPEDDAIAIFSPVAILKDAPHPHAAELFENFMYSRAYSEALVKSYNFPLRRDASAPNRKTLEEIRWYRNTAIRLADGIPQAIELWQKVFGG